MNQPPTSYPALKKSYHLSPDEPKFSFPAGLGEEIEKDPSKEFRFGEGKTSGILSLVLGILSLLAVFAYLYPSYFTTT